MEKENKELEEQLKEAFRKCNGHDDVEFIELDDEVEFNCNRCGACCTGRDDIILTPYDVYNLAIALNLPTKEVFKKYLQVHIGEHSHLPVVTIADTPAHKCPFLEFDPVEMLYKCSVNDYKPGVCKTHPFGIMRSINKQTQEPEAVKFIRTSFCDNHGGNKITVREFLGDYFDTLEERNVSYKLQSFVTNLLNLPKIAAIIREDFSNELFSPEERESLKEMPEKVVELLYQAYVYFYLDSVYVFELDKSFLEQTDEAFVKMIKRSIELKCLMAYVDIDISPNIDIKDLSELYRKYISEEEILSLIKNINERLDKIVGENL